MGSHLGAIGVPPDVPFADALQQMMASAAQVGSTPDGRVEVYAWQDPSGSRATITLEDRRVTCLTPGFLPATRLTVQLGTLAANECRYERPLLVDVLTEAGEMAYPLAVTVDDLGVSEGVIKPGVVANLEVAAIADRFDRYADEAAYRTSGTPMAVASVIPAGLFAPGVAQEEHAVSSTALVSGTVRSAQLRRHELFGYPFVTAVLASYAAEYVVCLDVADLGGPAAPEVPGPGSIISGQFYLSGRLVPTD